MDLDVAQLVAQVARRGEHLQDLVQRAGTASRVRPREKDRETTPVAEPTRHLDGVRVDDRGPLVITAVGEHPGKGREQTDPERGFSLAEGGARLLEQLQRPTVRPALPPAGVLQSDRRPRKHFRVAGVAADLRGRGERLDRAGPAAGSVTGGPELELNLRPLRRTLDAQPERRPKVVGRLLERECRHRRSRRSKVVVDCPLRVAHGPGRREMVGHVSQAPAGSYWKGVLEGRPHPQVQLCATKSAQPIVERAAHEFVGEAVGRLRGGGGLDHPVADGFVKRRQQPALVELDGASDDLERELGSRNSSGLEDPGCRRVEP